MSIFFISKRVKRIEVSGIRKIFDLSSKLRNPVDLSIGQPDFDAPLSLKKAAMEAIKKGFNRYVPTQGILLLRQKIAQELKKKNRINVGPDQILVTSGVSGGLFLVLATLMNEGDEMIVFDPFFVGYKQLASFLGIRIRFIDTYPDFRPKIEKAEVAINKKTKAVLINSPANPTGVVWRSNEVKKIVKITKKHKLILISDEVYEDFVYDDLENFSPASIDPQVITLGGFSKSLGIPGWRLGFVCGPKETIRNMAKLQQYTFVCAPSFAQVAVAETLDVDTAKQIKKNYQEKRDLVFNALKQDFEVLKPEGAFYMFVKAPAGRAKQFVERAAKKNLLIVPGSVFSRKDSHFRISFAVKQETLLRGVKILKEIKREIKT